MSTFDADFLSDLGQPVSYFPALSELTGNVAAGIFLSKMLYWRGKEARPELGIYKTKGEIRQETGLTIDMQDTAIQRLKYLKIVTTWYDRLNHKLYYKIDWNQVARLWAERQTGFPNQGFPFRETEIPGSPAELSNAPETEIPGSGKGQRPVRNRKHISTTKKTTKNNDTSGVVANSDAELRERILRFEAWREEMEED